MLGCVMGDLERGNAGVVVVVVVGRDGSEWGYSQRDEGEKSRR